MAKKKTEITEQVKVQFISTYMGIHGNFYEGKIYEIDSQLFDILKSICEEV
jgi:hypothetical protein